MADGRCFVIVGASLAGASAAAALRAEGFDGRVVLIGEEPFYPYERPPLSKEILRGQEERSEHKLFVHPNGFYSEQSIDLRLSTQVSAIDTAGRKVALRSGERLGYEQLLLATGAQVRRLRVPGSELGGVHYLRTLTDSQQLQGALKGAGRVVVIGGGWIGCEVAASARQMGAQVALIERGQLPLDRVLGRELGRFYRDVHEAEGVELHLGVGVSELRGRHNVEAVLLTDGTAVEGDVIVAGIGVTPRVELAQAAGLELDNGIVTDKHLATSVPGIFAAGDVADAHNEWLGGRLRLEHWVTALKQGPIAARNMLGKSTSYDLVPFFFSDQYDVGIEYYGLARPSDQVVIRGDPGSRKFVAFWLHRGRIVAGMHSNTWDASGPIEALVKAKRPLNPGELADTGIELASLVAA